MSRGKKSRSPVSDLVKQSITHPQSGKRNNESVHADDKSNTIEMPMNDDLDSELLEEQNNEWQKVISGRSNKIQKTNPKNSITTCPLPEQTTQASNIPTSVHSYFSFGEHQSRTKPKFNSVIQSAHDKKMKPNFPPFKLEFERQHKPAEIQVLNELVKHNKNLNVSSALYSSYPQTRHVLLLFANDSSSYELLFENKAWPNSICGLSFNVKFPHRIPTSYSIIVNQIPRNWDIASIQPLIATRYPSMVQAVRMFRESKPTNRIRIDFRSNDDVQAILQCSNIYIDSIRYPASPYKPLARIDRCFRCQQFGHKSTNCTNEPKCYKCGEPHEYQKVCSNAVKCANCLGSHMAGAPECLVKISYRKEQQQNNPRLPNNSSKYPYLSSPAQLYSNILKTTTPLPQTNIQKNRLFQRQESSHTNDSSLIIATIKEEINRSQNILMERIMQLELKCETAHEQQKSLHTAIENQILPQLSTVSGLFVTVCQQLVQKKVIELSDQHLVQLSQLCSPTTTTPLSSTQSFSPNFSPVFKFLPSTPPLPDTPSSNHHPSSSFFQLLTKTNENHPSSHSHPPSS